VNRSKLVIEASFVLMLASAGACLAFLLRGGHFSFSIVGLAFLVPAVSTVLFLCISLAVPDLYAIGRLRPPLTLTLPLIYTAMLLLTTMLITRVGLSIARVSDNFAAINLWANGWLLLGSYVAGALFLTLLGRMDSKAVER
jgi:hypothetical protein